MRRLNRYCWMLRSANLPGGLKCSSMHNICQSLSFRHSAAQRAQLLVNCIRSGLVRWQRVFVLFMYVCMNVGLPIGSPVQASQPSSPGCRCAPEIRAAGRCCCVKVKSAPNQSSCCAKRSVPQPKQCCTKKPAEAVAPSQEPAQSQPIELVSNSCPCGPVDSPLVLICPQHRILVDVSSIAAGSGCEERLITLSSDPCGDRPRPCVPPPEFSEV